MSELVTNKITPATGSSDTVTLGDSGDTFTIPAGVTLAGSGASLTALPAANLTGTAAVANGGTGATTHTANNVLVGNGTSAIASVAPSTSGNILTSTGSAWASSTPAAPASGMWKFISTQSASSSSTIDFLTLDTSTYKVFEVQFHRVFPSAHAVPQIRLANGSTIYTGGTYYGFASGGKHNTSANTIVSAGWGDSSGQLMPESAIANGAIPYSGSVTVYNMETAYNRVMFQSSIVASGSGGYKGMWISGGSESSASYASGLNGIQLLLSTGNFTSGFFSLYGLLEA